MRHGSSENGDKRKSSHSKGRSVGPPYLGSQCSLGARILGCFWSERILLRMVLMPPEVESHWFYGFMMGLPSLGAFLICGVATIYLGAIGPVLGWPVYMGMVIVTANIWGWIRGEWPGSDLKTYVYLSTGILSIITAVYVVSLGQ